MLSIIHENSHGLKGSGLQVKNNTAPAKINVIKFKSFEVKFSPIKPIV